MSVAPIPQWWDEEETSQQSQWDAGIVDAGSESASTIFHLWNNRGNSASIADMINVDITVRDINGQTTDLTIAGQQDGVVMCQFFDSVKQEWGAYVDDVWVKDAWAELLYNDPQAVVASNGAKRTIAGASNSGSLSDTSNFAQIKLKLFAKPTATAGQVAWITRVSYQYI